MDPKRATNVSKYLSLILRHEPHRVGIALDEHGWVDVDTLLCACEAHGQPISEEELKHVVDHNDKQRFAFSEDGTRIRANQGHSVEVQLDHPVATPPELLYHGTTDQVLGSIRSKGLHKGERHDVHLSATMETARKVGMRRGQPVILVIRAGEMHRAGYEFHLTPNQVWLVQSVPPQFIEFPAPLSFNTGPTSGGARWSESGASG
jgi:putative RNA 2'-phosphotransferase